MRQDTDAPRILIVRLSAIGDTIYTLPVLNALRDHFPQATLGWLVSEHCSGVLRGHRSLDHLISVDRRWLKSPQRVWQVRRQLRELSFDVTLDVQGLAKSAVPAWLAGTKRRIGFVRSDREGREFSTWFNNELVSVEQPHVIDRNLALLRPLGIQEPNVRFDIPEHPHEIEAVSQFLQKSGLNGGYAVVNLGAAWASKRWPADRFAEVIRYLSSRQKIKCVLPWGNAQERQDALAVANDFPGQVVVLPERWSLTQLGSLFRRSQFFLGSDTGPLHLAAAVGTHCIALFGSSVVSRHRPFGDSHLVLCHHFVATGGEMRNTDDAAMRLISVEEVCQACETVMIRDSGGVATHFSDAARRQAVGAS